MSNSSTSATAGLVFLQDREFDIVELANHLVSCIEGHGTMRAEIHIHSDISAKVSSPAFDLDVRIKEDVGFSMLEAPAPVTVALRARTTDRMTQTSRNARDLLLVRALQRLQAVYAPEYINWINTSILLSRYDFTSAIDDGRRGITHRDPNEKPRRTMCHKPLPNVDEVAVTLQSRMTDAAPVKAPVAKPDADMPRARGDAIAALALTVEDVESKSLSASLGSVLNSLAAPIGLAHRQAA